MLCNDYGSRSLLLFGIKPRNSTPFTGLFLTGRRSQAGHETTLALPPSFRHYTANDRTWEWGGATTDVHYLMVCLFILPQCLVIGEITCDHMIVVLNKIDLVEPSKREAQIAKVTNTQPVSPLMSSKGNMFLMIFEQAVEYYTHALLRAFSL